MKVEYTPIQNVINPPNERCEHRAVSYNHEIFVTGGEDMLNFRNDCFFFNTKTHKWEQLPKCSIATSLHSCILHDDKVFLFGGFPNPTKQSIHIFNLKTKQWEVKKYNEGPKDTYGNSCVLLPDSKQVILFGGFYDNDVIDDLWFFDLTSFKFRQVEKQGVWPQARHNHTAVVYNSDMIIYGGNVHERQLFGDVFIFDTKKEVWNKIDVLGQVPEPRYGHSSFVFGDWMIVLFGASQKFNEFFNQIYAFNLKKKEWKLVQFETKELPLGRRHHASAVVHSDDKKLVIWVHGGFGAYEEIYTDSFYITISL